jgi:hypothetical protein
MRRTALPAALLAVGAVGLTGCTGSGGGTLASSNPAASARATFGMTFRMDDATGASTFAGTYLDRQGVRQVSDGAGGTVSVPVDVRIQGTGRLLPLSAPPGQTNRGGCVGNIAGGTPYATGGGPVTYTSADPSVPPDRRAGTLSLQLCDNDGDGRVGRGGADTLLIIVDTGPYAGYQNGGLITGNISTAGGTL